MNEARFGIVVSRFNEEITSRLLKSCVETLKSRGVAQQRLSVYEVPGAYEIPWAAQEMALSGKVDVLIALGAVLKGATPQNEHIARSVIRQLHQMALSTRVPCVLGVITPDTMAQARARTKGSLDRGRESALAALELAELRDRIQRELY